MTTQTTAFLARTSVATYIASVSAIASRYDARITLDSIDGVALDGIAGPVWGATLDMGGGYSVVVTCVEQDRRAVGYVARIVKPQTNRLAALTTEPPAALTRLLAMADELRALDFEDEVPAAWARAMADAS